MKYVPKEIPEQENVNVTPIPPLVNFAYLLATVVIVSLLFYLGLGWTANLLVAKISPETEVKIGQQLVPEDAFKDEEIDPNQQAYLEKLLLNLQKFQTQGEKANTPPLDIYLIDSEQPNAGILPGGHIIVTSALLNVAESENELAFVIAHELGHFHARDPLKALGRSLVFLFIQAILGVGNHMPADASGTVILTRQLQELHYTRQQELSADVYALELIINYYGHGGDSLEFFETVKVKDQRSKLREYFSTHPLTQDRINHLQKLAQEKQWLMEGKVTPLPNFSSTKEN